MKIKKGTIVFLSELGYYNFVYPIKDKSIVLEEDSPVLKRIIGWIHDKDYLPFLIKYKGELKTIWIKKEDSKTCIID